MQERFVEKNKHLLQECTNVQSVDGSCLCVGAWVVAWLRACVRVRQTVLLRCKRNGEGKKKGSRNKYKKNRRDAVQAVPSLIVPRSQMNANAVRTFYLNLCNLFNRVNNRVYVGSVRS